MKVWPKNDQMRKLMVHPNGTKFRDTGPAEWPDDAFTTRRLRDGDVTAKAPPERPPQRKSADADKQPSATKGE